MAESDRCQTTGDNGRCDLSLGHRGRCRRMVRPAVYGPTVAVGAAWEPITTVVGLSSLSVDKEKA